MQNDSRMKYTDIDMLCAISSGKIELYVFMYDMIWG